jgi:hypothetical protein
MPLASQEMAVITHGEDARVRFAASQQAREGAFDVSRRRGPEEGGARCWVTSERRRR